MTSNTENTQQSLFEATVRRYHTNSGMEEPDLSKDEEGRYMDARVRMAWYCAYPIHAGLAEEQQRIALLRQEAMAFGLVLAPADRLKAVYNDLDACQQIIWRNVPGADPSYCADAQARMKEIQTWLSPQSPE